MTPKKIRNHSCVCDNASKVDYHQYIYGGFQTTKTFSKKMLNALFMHNERPTYFNV